MRASTTTALVLAASVAVADVYSQPAMSSGWGDGTSLLSTHVTNSDSFSAYSFDDFDVTGAGWHISTITVIGEQSIGPFGQTTNTSPVHVRISSQPNFVSAGTTYFSLTTPVMTIGTGDTTVSGLSIDLAPGRYWLSVWMDMIFNREWFWRGALPPAYGDFAYVHNPGGGYELGTSPLTAFSASDGVFRDLAFSITYSPVPEPAGLIAVGGLALGFFLRQRR